MGVQVQLSSVRPCLNWRLHFKRGRCFKIILFYQEGAVLAHMQCILLIFVNMSSALDGFKNQNVFFTIHR